MLKPFNEYSIALKSFINLDKINWPALCGNPNIFNFHKPKQFENEFEIWNHYDL
jgi:hypothetical protein